MFYLHSSCFSSLISKAEYVVRRRGHGTLLRGSSWAGAFGWNVFARLLGEDAPRLSHLGLENDEQPGCELAGNTYFLFQKAFRLWLVP